MSSAARRKEQGQQEPRHGSWKVDVPGRRSENRFGKWTVHDERVEALRRWMDGWAHLDGKCRGKLNEENVGTTLARNATSTTGATPCP